MSLVRTTWGLALLGLHGLAFAGLATPSTSEAQSTQLTAYWETPGVRLKLKAWKRTDLLKLKRTVSLETDLETSQLIRWQGILISQILDSALEELPAESRAQIDLVVLRGRYGKIGFVPRAFISKYPLMLAFEWSKADSRKADSRKGSRAGGAIRADELSELSGAIHSVVPWSSKPKILKEDLPLESFFISDVVQLELTSYREQFSSFFLKRRTDPLAIRGEKLFIQNCVSCHLIGPTPGTSLVSLSQLTSSEAAQRLILKKHPSGTYSGKLTEKERRAVGRYLDAHRLENPLPTLPERVHSVVDSGNAERTQAQ